MTDAEITRALSPLWPITYAKVPVPGTWLEAPFPPRLVDDDLGAVVCTDHTVVWVVVSRRTGEVRCAIEEGSTLINASLAQLVECAHAYAAALDEGASAAELRARVAAIDPRAIVGDNQLWSVAAEELDYD